jgi:signal transduction histidine kinase/ligand-binding sensor domain-containing protein
MIIYRHAFIVLLLLPFYCFGQDNLLFRHISVEQGLSQSTVYKIAQDNAGFIWMATGDGIDRYDGKDFSSYRGKFGDTTSDYPEDKNINSKILEDRFGRLWFASDAGVFYMDKKYGSIKMALQKQAALIAIEQDTIWLTNNEMGLFALNIQNFKYSTYPLKGKKKWTCVFYDAVMTKKRIWLATNFGLMLFNMSTHSFLDVYNEKKIIGVRLLHYGGLLFTAVDGIYIYNPEHPEYKLIPLTEGKIKKDEYWYATAEYSRTHTLYIGSHQSGNICAYNLLTGRYKIFSLQKNAICDLFIDNSENLWIGTDGGGVYKADLKPPKFYCYPYIKEPRAFPDNSLMVKSAYRDKTGKIWIGTYNKGLVIYDPENNIEKKLHLPGSAKTVLPRINFINNDSSGNIIITAGDKVIWYDPELNKITRQITLPPYANTDINEISDIYSVVEWKKGHYLLASNLGMYSLNCSVTAAPSIHFFMSKIGWSYKLKLCSDGSVLVGERSGFKRFVIKNDTTIQFLDEGFEKVSIKDFYQSERGAIIWMASDAGLIAYNTATKKYQLFDERQGIANSHLYSILPQNDTTFWLSTNNGISNANITNSSLGDISVRFINYSVKDGLQSNEFNTGAYYRGSDGCFIFGGIEGINWFYPAKMQLNPHNAIPFITAIRINDSAYADDTAAYVHSLSLPYYQNTVEFSFKGLEYTNPDANCFAYKLDGFDRSWIYSSSRSVRYPNLPPGSYTFLLKASNNDGVWNNMPLAISVVILPPYWQTWWFRVSMFIIAVTVAIFVSRLYTKQKLKEKNLQIEKQRALYEERLRISKDVHDDLGSGLSKINLMAATAMQRSQNEKINNTVEQISQVSKDLIGNMRDLVWVLNPENTTLDNLAARIREYCFEYLEGLPIQLIVNFPDHIPATPISREAQKNIFLTVKEAVHNIVKHAKADQINIALCINNDILTLTINDTGTGFDISKLRNSGNGLKNMKLRIEQIGGNLQLNTNRGQGTTINVNVNMNSIINK